MEKTKTVIQPPAGIHLNLKELWQYRELVYFFTWRDIKVKYKQTFLGVLWAVLQPLGMMAIFTVLFSRSSLAKASHDMSYEVFVLSGLILWSLFNTSVSHAADSMVTNSNIIKKIYFPRLIIPVAAITAALLDFLIMFIIFLIFCLIYKQSIHWSALIYFPLAILLCLFFSFGLGTWLGAVNVKYRDFRYALPFLLQLLFFGTQIIYNSAIVENTWLQHLLALNPMNAVIELFRAPLSSKAADPSMVWIGCISGLLATIAGLFYFSKTESYFADLA